MAQHEHGAAPEVKKAPRVYLDKSPRIVQYQLGRLTADQLLLIETQTDDPKYIPVFTAILSRVGMSPAARENALAGLMTINGSSASVELSQAILATKLVGEGEARSVDGLAKILLRQPVEELAKDVGALKELCKSSAPQVVSIGCAAMITAGLADEARALAAKSGQEASFFDSVKRVRATEERNALLQSARQVALDTGAPASIRQAAIGALGHIPAEAPATFEQLAELLQETELQPALFESLLAVQPADRPVEASRKVAAWLVDYAEATPVAKRTEDTFLDAMQLVDQLIAKLPSDQAKRFRERLRETVVRVVRIHTVEEEMRYDIPFFAVEAGRPVQVVLVNEDLMPHNLVFTKPGALKQVAEEGFEAGTANGLDGKQYVPKSDQVLFATHMIAARETARLTFTAPEQPGEYPYVCTFPRHWMRMYGVMVVVDDLEAWNKSPTKPTDPIGSNRSFVQNWTVDDLKGDLAEGLKGRSPEIGSRLFQEATCAGCHHAGELKIGSVGPELNDLYKRWKSDRVGVLREILEPSHKIDEKYAVQLLLTIDGDTLSGLVVDETKDTISILENPESTMPTTIAKAEIEERVKTSNSMMPKGLLNQYSKDEIFEIMAFIESVQSDTP
ncbi:MAG: hypothetical protein Aurels2KO_09240 [Aureliella sp.]